MFKKIIITLLLVISLSACSGNNVNGNTIVNANMEIASSNKKGEFVMPDGASFRLISYTEDIEVTTRSTEKFSFPLVYKAPPLSPGTIVKSRQLLKVEGKTPDDSLEIYRYSKNNKEIPVYVKVSELEKLAKEIDINESFEINVQTKVSMNGIEDLDTKYYIKGYLFEFIPSKNIKK